MRTSSIRSMLPPNEFFQQGYFICTYINSNANQQKSTQNHHLFRRYFPVVKTKTDIDTLTFPYACTCCFHKQLIVYIAIDSHLRNKYRYIPSSERLSNSIESIGIKVRTFSLDQEYLITENNTATDGLLLLFFRIR